MVVVHAATTLDDGSNDTLEVWVVGAIAGVGGTIVAGSLIIIILCSLRRCRRRSVEQRVLQHSLSIPI